MCEDLIKNDVPAVGQLQDDECVSFVLRENADIKIAFVGNSITRHGVAEHLGWHGDWGMAASCRENDYVHRVVAAVEKQGKRASYCVVNCGAWETSWNDGLLAQKYSKARDFGADIVIMRLGENARLLDRAKEFMPHYEAATDFFSRGKARVVLTDLFWEYEPFDSAVRELAKARGYAFAPIHDLGSRNDMKAVGKFAHEGVAAHPGDEGMKAIAERICKALEINI